MLLEDRLDVRRQRSGRALLRAADADARRQRRRRRQGHACRNLTSRRVVACRQVRGRSRRCRARIGDAVGDADRAEAAAGEEHAGQRGEVVVDRGHALEVPDFVLRALTRPTKKSRDEGITGDAEQVFELVARRPRRAPRPWPRADVDLCRRREIREGARDRRARGRATSTSPTCRRAGRIARRAARRIPCPASGERPGPVGSRTRRLPSMRRARRRRSAAIVVSNARNSEAAT